MSMMVTVMVLPLSVKSGQGIGAVHFMGDGGLNLKAFHRMATKWNMALVHRAMYNTCLSPGLF